MSLLSKTITTIENFIPSQVIDILNSTIKTIASIEYLPKFVSFIKFIIKDLIAAFIILINTILILLIINYFLTPYNEISRELNFYYDDSNNANIISELYFNCSQRYNWKSLQCTELQKAKYSIELLLEIANRADTNDKQNYSAELKVYTQNGEVLTFKKLFFFEGKELLSDMVTKINYLPFRLLGYFLDTPIRIIFAKEYQNYRADKIKKVDVIIKSRMINVKKAIILFIPNNNIIQRYYGYFKYIILAVIFCIAFWIQFAIVGCLFLTQKLLSTKSDIKKD